MQYQKKITTIISIAIISAFSLNAFAKLPYYPIQFPRDDAAHHENVPYKVDAMTEWWYYNGMITSTTGRHFGYFTAAFNLTIPVGDQKIKSSILMVQISDVERQKVYGNYTVFDENESMFSTKALAIKLRNNFSLQKNANTYYLKEVTLDSNNIPIKLNLAYSQTKAPLLVGKTGLIDMWDDTNSYYYSNTRLKTTGSMQIGDEVFTIDPDKSSSWMDHQWGDFILERDKAQWIWSSVQLTNGMDVSIFTLIDGKTKKPIWKLGNVIMPDDNRLFMTDVELAPFNSSNSYPSAYNFEVPSLKLKLKLEAMVSHQDTDGFWEGIHHANGMYNGKVVNGYAFVENTVVYNKLKIDKLT